MNARVASLRILLAVPVILAALAASGCRSTAPAAVEQPMMLAADPQAVRTAAVNLLEDMHFEVQLPPQSPERIDTLPMVSAYPLEFWRDDTVTRRDKCETALHTVRRTVTMQVTESADGSRPPHGTAVEITVCKERLSLPHGLDARSSVESYGKFGGTRKALESFEEHWGRGSTWVDYGRDADLEQKILHRLRERL